jgi:biopolymer transport protein ExbD
MKKTSRRGHSTLNELNITPLLDLVFVLLVIFIITTPQMVNSLEMALPSGKPPVANPNAPKPKINHILVDEKGQIFLNDAAVPDDQL